MAAGFCGGRVKMIAEVQKIFPGGHSGLGFMPTTKISGNLELKSFDIPGKVAGNVAK